MSNKGKFDADLVSISSIKTLKGNIEVGNIDFQGSPDTYQFSFSTITNIERLQKLIRFLIDVEITNVDAKNVPTGTRASFTNEFVFKIDNLEELVMFNEGMKTAQIDIELGIAMAGMAYSTMRGIIHMRTQGTVLNGIILPVVKPINLLSTGENKPQLVK